MSFLLSNYVVVLVVSLLRVSRFFLERSLPSAFVGGTVVGVSKMGAIVLGNGFPLSPDKKWSIFRHRSDLRAVFDYGSEILDILSIVDKMVFAKGVLTQFKEFGGFFSLGVGIINEGLAAGASAYLSNC
ncbi:hypothetical protein BJ875DRAFT_441602 [Amylocarpus encephaloides]|uniref:Uncharacterized protein n=1 Tax=Amylocarpus encephaloides TaxID=45428 RepID=A0A9P7YJ94_9HELO|nr:hypothetical protein BJ875DRAFT_441602 [Amylocarpus encephaloides]